MATTKIYVATKPVERGGNGRYQFYAYTVTQEMVNVIIDAHRYQSESAILRLGNFLKVDHFGSKRACDAKEDEDPEKMVWMYTTDEVIFINSNTEVSLNKMFLEGPQTNSTL